MLFLTCLRCTHLLAPSSGQKRSDRMHPRINYGTAVQAQATLQAVIVLGACYLIANPEYTPIAIRPHVSRIRSAVERCCIAVFVGWWPVVTG